MPSEAGQSQSQIFCGYWLPTLFHNTPQHFLTLLNRDGNKFLRFYWDQSGKDLSPDLCRDPFGLNHIFREPVLNTLITIVALPEPQIDGETYYMGLIFRPNRRLFLVSDMTMVLGLEKSPSPEQDAGTQLIEISRRMVREKLRVEPIPPHQEDFYEAVLAQLD